MIDYSSVAVLVARPLFSRFTQTDGSGEEKMQGI
jgi:hypothetical protein